MSETSPDSSSDRRVVFLHVPKTAGTTFHTHLASHFPKEQLCPIRYNTLLTASPEDLLGYRLFSGHFCGDSIARIPEPKSVVTFLREPKARILSLYYFWRSRSDEWIEERNLKGPRLATQNSLLEFLRLRDPIATSNTDSTYARTFIGEESFEKLVAGGHSDDDILRLAKSRLEEMTAVGVVEQMETSVALVCTKLGLPIPLKQRRLNVLDERGTGERRKPVEREEVTPEIEEELSRLTRIDGALYQHAQGMFQGLLLSQAGQAIHDLTARNEQLSEKLDTTTGEFNRTSDELSVLKKYPWKALQRGIRRRLSRKPGQDTG